jgi:hypothetical protein
MTVRVLPVHASRQVVSSDNGWATVLLAAGSRDGDDAVGEPIEVVVARRQLHYRPAPVERTSDHVENHPRSGCARGNSTVTIARAQPSAGLF